MKYDEKLFQLSSEYSEKMENENCNIYEPDEQYLLKILFEKFKKEINNKNVFIESGIVRVKFKDEYYKDPEKGYLLIKRLWESDQFNAIAKEYCFYLGDREDRYDEQHNSYFEIIWDYQRYFETFCLNLLEKEEALKESYPELAKMLENFNELPNKYQMAIVQSFIENVMVITKKHEHELILEKCMREGHQFSKWQKKTQTVYQIVNDNTPSVGPSLGRPIEKNYWERTCDRCQYVEKVEEEPQELIAERKEKEEEISKLVNQRKEAKQEILRLEKRIKELKESM